MLATDLRRLGLIVALFVLQTTLLRAALPGPEDAPAQPSLAGQLLVAAPDIGDPRFERTVILIVVHGPGGAVGIVVNRPIGDQPLAGLLRALGQDDSDAAGSVRLFLGGPLQPELGFVVHSPDYRRPETIAVSDRLSLTASVAVLRDIGDGKGPAKALVAFGYAGWGPDQLEHEIQAHAWATAEADPALVFDEDRANVWDLAWKRRTQRSELESPGVRIGDDGFPSMSGRAGL